MQREVGPVVIERDGLPGLRVVTGVTPPAQLALMGLLTRVTGNALVGCLAKLLSGLMAAVASHGGVRARQREVGHFVIERLTAEFHNIRPAPSMLYMACATLSCFDSGHATVKAGSGTYVRGNFLVAVEAQLPLVTAVASVMTG